MKMREISESRLKECLLLSIDAPEQSALCQGTLSSLKCTSGNQNPLRRQKSRPESPRNHHFEFLDHKTDLRRHPPEEMSICKIHLRSQ